MNLTRVGEKRGKLFWISLILLAMMFSIWTRLWWQHGPGFKGDWPKFIHVVKSMKEGVDHAYAANIPRGYPLFILLAAFLTKQTYMNAVHILLFFIWSLSFIATWLAVRSKTVSTSANMVVFFLIYYLYHENFFSISLLAEALYSSLMLIAFSFLVLWQQSKHAFYLLLLGGVLCYAHEVRPFPLFGVALPLVIYFFFQNNRA